MCRPSSLALCVCEWQVSAPLILGLDITDNATVQTIVPYITNREARSHLSGTPSDTLYIAEVSCVK